MTEAELRCPCNYHMTQKDETTTVIIEDGLISTQQFPYADEIVAIVGDLILDSSEEDDVIYAHAIQGKCMWGKVSPPKRNQTKEPVQFTILSSDLIQVYTRLDAAGYAALKPVHVYCSSVWKNELPADDPWRASMNVSL